MRYLLILLLPVIFSCGQRHTFLAKKNMPETGVWVYDDAFVVDFEADKGLPYDIYFEIVHTGDYPFENIYLRIIDDFKGKQDTDIVNLNLSNPYGIWYGEESSDKYYFRSLLRKGFKFDDSGKHRIKIEQYTRRDSLEGVSLLEFYLDKVQ